MVYYIAVAFGGAVGAVSRYWLMNIVKSMSAGSAHAGFPWGTLTVNIIGSLLIGVLFIVLSEKMAVPEAWRGLLIVGYLGAFTTFSTFSLDALLLLQQGNAAQALAYILSSVLICTGAAWAGVTITRALI